MRSEADPVGAVVSPASRSRGDTTGQEPARARLGPPCSPKPWPDKPDETSAEEDLENTGTLPEVRSAVVSLGLTKSGVRRGASESVSIDLPWLAAVVQAAASASQPEDS